MGFDLGGAMLTSIISYTDRDVMVVRDATSAVRQRHRRQHRPRPPTLPPQFGAAGRHAIDAVTQELRLKADDHGHFQWVVGGFYSDMERDYGQTLPTPGYELCIACFPAPRAAVGAPPDTPFFSQIPYDFKQTAFFAEGSFDITERFEPRPVGARYYDFSEDRDLYFGGLFADTDGLPTEPTNSPGSSDDDGVLPRVLFAYDVSDNVQLNAQASEGFRLGGINDPLNVPLCSPEDLVTFGGRDSFDSETLWNYELGAKIGFADGRGQFNIAAFHAESRTCRCRRGGHLLVAHHVQRAEGAFDRRRSSNSLPLRPTASISAFPRATPSPRSTRASLTDATATVVAGIEEGNRLPSVPEFQLSANATYSWPMTETVDGFITGVYQHVGSRYTQIGDQAAGFGTFTAPPLRRPDHHDFTFDPLLPAYDIGNLRFGVRGDNWEAALFVNNVADENALLGLDQERGRVARVGYLVNQPRTYGLSFRMDFGHDEPVGRAAAAATAAAAASAAATPAAAPGRRGQGWRHG